MANKFDVLVEQAHKLYGEEYTGDESPGKWFRVMVDTGQIVHHKDHIDLTFKDPQDKYERTIMRFSDFDSLKDKLRYITGITDPEDFRHMLRGIRSVTADRLNDPGPGPDFESGQYENPSRRRRREADAENAADNSRLAQKNFHPRP